MNLRKLHFTRKTKQRLITAGVCLGLALLCLCLAVGFGMSASKAKRRAGQYQSKLKKEQAQSNKLQEELEQQKAYLDEWSGVYEQLSQQKETEVQETEASQESSDSPYKEIHPDMQVTNDDRKAAISKQKTIYLTFDDGPSERTKDVLDALDVYGIKATFFVTYTDKPELQKYYKEIVDRGHTIGIHTASHEYNTIYASVENYLEDFYKIYELVYEQTGVRATIFRYPGGSTSLNSREAGAAIAQEMERRGFVYFDWNVSCGDGSNRATEESVLQSIVEGVAKYNNSVVLMHDTRQPTVNILPEVLNQLTQTGARFESLTPNSRKVQFYHKKY